MTSLVIIAAVLGLGWLASRRAAPGRPRQLPPTWRKVFLVAHVTTAIGWLAVVAGLIALNVVGLGATDAETERMAYGAIVVFDDVFFGYASPAALATGLTLSLGTRWGVLRHWWVGTKLAATIVLIVTGVLVLHQHIMRAPTDPSVRVPLLVGCVLSVATLLGAVLLSVFKPWGRTRRGRRGAATRLVVTEITTPADGVRVLRLAKPNNALLPPWEPGAHLDLVLPSGTVRQYSLIGNPAVLSEYLIAVRQLPNGRGGSTEVHQLQVGQRVGFRGPRNRFALVPAARYLFIAGGIGITPLLSMIDRVAATGADWRLVYAGRSPRTMPFAADLRDRYPDRVSLVPGRPDLKAVLRATAPSTAVYCCGPEEMLATVTTLAPDAHVERFTPHTAGTGPEFEVELASSGQVLTVPPDRRMLDVLREAAPAIDSSCGEGFCGTCAVPMLAGSPDHRDDVPDRPANVIHPCVSRATGRLVLDL